MLEDMPIDRLPHFLANKNVPSACLCFVLIPLVLLPIKACWIASICFLQPALFRKLWHFDMGGNLTTGSNEGHQCLTFLLPDIRFNQQDKFNTVELTLVGISSPVKIVMIMEDDSVLLETLLTEDDFDNNDEDHSKTFSFEKEEYKKISKHLGKSSRTILIWTDVSKLSKVHLKVEFE